MRIGMFGLGTVGSAVLTLVRERAVELARIAGEPVEIGTIVVRDGKRPRAVGLEGVTITSDPRAILDDPDCRTVIEVVGGTGPAAVFATEALRRNRTVITANKELVATMRGDLVRAASGGGRLFCEASVGAAIPLIRSQCLASGADHVERIEAVLNGTTNYILDRIEQGLTFEQALGDAQREGYAEQDPTSDIDGHDAARKLAILAGLAMGKNVYPEDILVSGIGGVRPSDTVRASSKGNRLRLVAGAITGEDGLCLYVLPQFISREHPLGRVTGTGNGVVISGRASGDLALFGPGAGGMPTAYAVVGDLVSALRGEPGLIDVLRRLTETPRARPSAVSAEVHLRPLEPGMSCEQLRQALGPGLAVMREDGDDGWLSGRTANLGEIIARCQGTAFVCARPTSFSGAGRQEPSGGKGRSSWAAPGILHAAGGMGRGD